MKIRDRIVELRRVKASELHPHPQNWRTHPKAQVSALRGAIEEIGFADAVLARETADGHLQIIDGHCRAEISGDEEVPVLVLDLDEDEAKLLLATVDPLAAMAEADREALGRLLSETTAVTESKALRAAMEALAEREGVDLFAAGGDGTPEDEEPRAKLTDKFIVPPFTVLDARQGYWQERKRAWVALGIRGEEGRVDTHTHTQQAEQAAAIKNQGKLRAFQAGRGART